MKERITVLIIVYGSILLYDWFFLKTNANRRDKAVYIIIMLISLYMGFDYAADKDWADFYDLIKPVLGETTSKIDKLLTVPGK